MRVHDAIQEACIDMTSATQYPAPRRRSACQLERGLALARLGSRRGSRRRCCLTGAVTHRLDYLLDRVDDELRLLELDVVPALGSDHLPRLRRQRRQLGL